MQTYWKALTSHTFVFLRKFSKEPKLPACIHFSLESGFAVESEMDFFGEGQIYLRVFRDSRESNVCLRKTAGDW